MNRGKKPLTARMRKRKDKETRNVAQAKTPADVNPEPTTTWKILAKFPKAIAKKDSSEVKGSMDRMEAKIKKHHSKHAKRSTPGQVETDVTPFANKIHPENKRERTNIEIQSVAQGRRLAQKLSKTKK